MPNGSGTAFFSAKPALPMMRGQRVWCLVVAVALGALPALGQSRPLVRSIVPPKFPLPPENVSSDSTRFSFVFYGGMRGREDGMEVQFEHSLVMRAMLDSIMARRNTTDPVRFILSNGDAVVDGRDARQWNVSYIPVIDDLTAAAGLPYFLAAGNHDVTESGNVNASGRRQGLANYLRATAKHIPPNGDARRLAGYPTYGFGYGNTFVIAFDSNIAADQKQFDWVKAQLESLDRSRYVHVIVVCHHPVFSSGPHGFPVVERPTAALRTKWMSLLRRHHVRLFLAGHDHLYEHWVERYYDSLGWHRLDQIVSGGGGAPLYTYRGDPDLSIYLGAGAEDSVRVEQMVRPGREPSENPYHFLIFHVDGEAVSMEVIGVAGGAGFQPYQVRPVPLRDPVRP